MKNCWDSIIRTTGELKDEKIKKLKDEMEPTPALPKGGSELAIVLTAPKIEKGGEKRTWKRRGVDLDRGKLIGADRLVCPGGSADCQSAAMKNDLCWLRCWLRFF